MKKIIAAALTLLCLTCAAVSVVSAEDIYYVRGDANGDGVVNVYDVTAVQRYAAELEGLNETCRRAADVNRSNVVDMDDATAIQRYLAEYKDSYRIGKTSYYDPYELPVVPNH